jgi:putative transposase
MPARNTIKIYVPDGIYHVYNRGVEKRIIFEDDYDYKVFLNCLKEALLPLDQLSKSLLSVTFKGQSFKGVRRQPKNFSTEIDLMAYSLMPNHFHLLLKQKHARSLDALMRSIATRYVIHFNKRHKRIGPLFQSRYKASLVNDEAYLLHVSRYLHRNSRKLSKDLIGAYSSYADYVGKRRTAWLKPNDVLDMFKPTEVPFLHHTNSYQQFVEFENELSDEAIAATYFLPDDDL